MLQEPRDLRRFHELLEGLLFPSDGGPDTGSGEPNGPDHPQHEAPYRTAEGWSLLATILLVRR